jgi:hypothetical protein
VLQNLLCATKLTLCYKTFSEIKNVLKLKLRLKNTIIDKTSTYASGTWILTKRDRKQIEILLKESV